MRYGLLGIYVSGVVVWSKRCVGGAEGGGGEGQTRSEERSKSSLRVLEMVVRLTRLTSADEVRGR